MHCTRYPGGLGGAGLQAEGGDEGRLAGGGGGELHARQVSPAFPAVPGRALQPEPGTPGAPQRGPGQSGRCGQFWFLLLPDGRQSTWPINIVKINILHASFSHQHDVAVKWNINF